MNNKKKRVEWIDILRGVAFFLVILSHTTTNDAIDIFINSFHMPLFFIISGMCLRKDKLIEESTVKQFTHKIQAYIIPYLWIELSLFPVWVLNNKILSKSKIALWDVLKGIIVSQNKWFTAPTNPVWFIGALFWASVYIFLIFKLTKENEYLRFVLVALVTAVGFFLKDAVTAYHMNTGMVGMGYMYLGYLVYNYVLVRWREVILRNRVSISMGFLAAGMFFASYNGMTSMVYGIYKNLFIYLGSSILLSMWLVVLCFECVENKWTSYIGQNTLYALGLHMILIHTVFKLCPASKEMLPANILLTMVLYWGLIPVVMLLNKFFPYLNGKYSSSTNGIMRFLMCCWCFGIPCHLILGKLGVYAGAGRMVKIMCILAVDIVVSAVISKWNHPFVFLRLKK